MNTRFAAVLFRCLEGALRPLDFLERVRQKVWNESLKASLSGSGTFFLHRSGQVVGTHLIRVGANFYAGAGFRLEALSAYHDAQYTPRVVIKDNVTINDYVHIGVNHYVEIGNNVLLASKVYISDHGHGCYTGPSQSSPDQAPAVRALTLGGAVVIEDNVWIGESVSVLSGVRIGRGSIIGANSVVTGDIEPYCIAVGVPARVIKRYNHAAHTWELTGCPARNGAATANRLSTEG